MLLRRQAHISTSLLQQRHSSSHRHQLRCASQSSDDHNTASVVVQQAARDSEALQVPPELDGFRPNVGCVVFSPKHNGRVFAATRLDDPGKSWQMPQGGIDPGETPQAAALRELQEETCISSVDVVAEIPRWLHYEFPTSVRCKLQGTWAQYRGQAQRWFLLKYTGQDDAEINLETEHREFAEWRWMPLHELPDSVISFKQEVYREVVAEFGPIIEAHVKSEAQQQ